MARKKRSTKLLLLTFVLLALCGGTYLAMELAPQDPVESPVEEESSTVEGELILGLLSTSFDQMEVENSKGTLSFVKENDQWLYSGDSDFPLDSSMVGSISSSFTHLESYNKIENTPDFGEYGLDEPLMTLTAKGDQVDVTIEVGDPAPMDSLRYISIGDGNVYLVDNSIFSNSNYSLDELLDMEELPTVNNFISITVGDRVIDYVAPAEDAEEAADVWFLEGEAVDATLVESLYDSISGLNWNSCVSYKADEAALREYGFDAPKLSATITYSEGDETLSYTLEIGSTFEDESGSYAYAHLEGSRMVYTVLCDSVSAIETALASLS